MASLSPGTVEVLGAEAKETPPIDYVELTKVSGGIAVGLADSIWGRGRTTYAKEPSAGFLAGLTPWALPAAVGSGALLLLVVISSKGK